MFEVFMAGVLGCVALWILARSIKRKGKSGCDCGSCSAHCPSYKKDAQ